MLRSVQTPSRDSFERFKIQAFLALKTDPVGNVGYSRQARVLRKGVGEHQVTSIAARQERMYQHISLHS